MISVGAGNDYGHPTALVETVVAASDGQKITFDKAASQVRERAPNAAQGGSTVSPSPSSGQSADDTVVYITATGSRYHRDGCRYLSETRIPVSLEEARARGYAPCSVCWPPW